MSSFLLSDYLFLKEPSDWLKIWEIFYEFSNATVWSCLFCIEWIEEAVGSRIGGGDGSHAAQERVYAARQRAPAPQSRKGGHVEVRRHSTKVKPVYLYGWPKLCHRSEHKSKNLIFACLFWGSRSRTFWGLLGLFTNFLRRRLANIRSCKACRMQIYHWKFRIFKTLNGPTVAALVRIKCCVKGIVKWQERRGVSGINRIIMTSHTIAEVF